MDLRKTVVRAGVDGHVEQFTLRVGDVVNPLRRNEDRVGYALAVAEDPYLAARTAEVAVNQISVATVA